LKRLLTTEYGQQPDIAPLLTAELTRRDQQPRPEPSPGRPKPIPRGLRAAPSRAEHAAYLRKVEKIRAEKQAPDKLSDQIIRAGKKARGEIAEQSDPPGLAGKILAAGRKRRGEDR
jgi:hypothetical protein